MKSVYIAAIIAGLVMLLLTVAIIVWLVAPPEFQNTPAEEGATVEIVLYAGEINDKYGYGFSSDNITSPGPEIKVKVGDVVKLVLVNVGKLPHALVVAKEAKDDPSVKPVFENAAVGSATKPLLTGERKETIFKVNKPGRYSYICPIPGHVTRGMYGTIIAE